MPGLRDIHHPTSENHPRVTIVIATYNRAEALNRSIRSAIAQSYTNWEMLVIGDACSDRTAEVIAGFGDSRIRFVNLPERFGEQAGPNSVGLMLVQTEYVAFLNHDDLWFPDHLDLALEKLDEEKTDFYWCRSAFFRNRGPREDMYLFFESTPECRTLVEAYDAPYYYVEPMSTWVGRTDRFQKLGVMKLSSETSLTPIKDFAIRAWHQGLKVSNGPQISVLKDDMAAVFIAGEKAKFHYGMDHSYSEHLIQQIERGEVDLLRRKIEADLWLAEKLELARSFAPMKSPAQDLCSDILFHTELDLIGLRANAAEDESMGLIGRVLTARTGETLTRQPDISVMIRYARKKLGAGS